MKGGSRVCRGRLVRGLGSRSPLRWNEERQEHSKTLRHVQQLSEKKHEPAVSGCGIFVAAALEIEPRALGMLSKHCPTELQAGYTRPVTISNGKGEQHGVQSHARHRGGYASHRGELCSKCIPEIRPFPDHATLPLLTEADLVHR